MSEAIGFGGELAELSSRLTGCADDVRGGCDRSLWNRGLADRSPDLHAVEDGNAAMMANDEWRKLIDRAGHAFQRLWRRG